jgi:hypothetical protein
MKNTKTRAERRDFLRQAGLGALSLSAIATALGMSENGAARVLATQTGSHVEDFLQNAVSARLSADSYANFAALREHASKLILGDAMLQERLIEVLNRLYESYAAPVRNETDSLGLPRELSDALAVAYLSCENGDTEGPMSSEDVQIGLQYLGDDLAALEPNFLNTLLPSMQYRMGTDAEFEMRVSTAKGDLVEHIDATVTDVSQDPPAPPWLVGLAWGSLAACAATGANPYVCGFALLVVVAVVLVKIFRKKRCNNPFRPRRRYCRT